MAYALKTTRPANIALSVVLVDQDGQVRDLVSGRSVIYNAAIAAPRIGTATWKTVSRSHFKTDYGADQYAPRGVVYDGTPPAAVPSLPMGGETGANGISWFCAVNRLIDAAPGNVFWLTGDNNQGARVASGSKLEVLCGGTQRGVGTTTLPAATKMSFGWNQKYNVNGLPLFFGLESGELAADGVYNEGGYASTSVMSMYGGHVGYGSARSETFVHAVFSDTTLLTEAEFQDLHDDWFGTLIDAPVIVPFTGTAVLTRLRVHAVPAAGAFGAVYRVTGIVADRATDTPRANLTNIDAAFFDEFLPSNFSTPKQVISNLTTDGTGRFSWLLPGSALTLGQTGTMVTYHPSIGFLGAYHLPLVS